MMNKIIKTSSNHQQFQQLLILCKINSYYQQLYQIYKIISSSMDESVESNQHYVFQMSDRENDILSDREEKVEKVQKQQEKQEKKQQEEKNQKQDNPQATIQTNMSMQKRSQKSSSKILIKQKDRYENKGIEKGMFINHEQSVDQLKIIYSGTDLKKQESTESIKKRRPLKLNPLENSSGVKLISQDQLNKNSKNYQLSSKVSLKPINVTPVRVKQIPNLFQFVKESIPLHKKLIGIMKRNRAGTKRLFPQYDLFMNQQVKFIMSSKRKPWHLTSTYHMGINQQPVNENDRDYVSTLKSNFSGSQFTLFNNSVSEGESQMLATIIFTNQISCNQVPRSLQVFILSPFFKYEDLAGADRNMNLSLKDLYELGQNQQNKKIIKLVNRKPTWDHQKQVWCMDFHGKALYSSVKNMILQDEEGRQCMMIGKAGEDVFNMTISFPLSPRIALGVASSSFDFKWVSQ